MAFLFACRGTLYVCWCQQEVVVGDRVSNKHNVFQPALELLKKKQINLAEVLLLFI